DHPRRRDGTEPSAAGLGEPEVAIRTRNDVLWLRIRIGKGEFRDRAVGHDTTNLARCGLREPDIAVWTKGDAVGLAVTRWREVVGPYAIGENPADGIVEILGKPDTVVG